MTDTTDISFLGDSPIARALELMVRLRDKDSGCPWDVEQTYASIVRYTIEEAYEVADAVERMDMTELRSELGDLLLQVVFFAHMAQEDGHFDFGDVADALTRKMVRRHPHVFGDLSVSGALEQTVNWEAQKAKERASQQDTGVLDGVAMGLPALMRAQKLQKRAARVGFDWPDVRPALDKVIEETHEVIEVMDTGANAQRLEEEMGDLLFAMVNIARHIGVDAEVALRAANAKFTRRFEDIEATLAASNKDIKTQGLDALDALWDAAKAKGL